MKYGEEVAGVKLNRDVLTEHFAGLGDIRLFYTVTINDDCISEHEDPHKMSNELKLIGERILSIARFLKRKKRP